LNKRRGGARRGALDLWLAKEMILPADLPGAKTWGTITAGAHRRGRPRPLNDTWIAACCIETGLPLLTSTDGTSPLSPSMTGWCFSTAE